MLNRVASHSGSLRAETMYEKYERQFLLGQRLARLRDWRHNRVSDLCLEVEDYEPPEPDPVDFHGEPQSYMSMSIPYVVDLDDEQRIARVGRANEAALGKTCVAGMERSS